MTKNTIEIDAGQLLIAGFEGPEPPSELLRAIARAKLAGFILFKRNLGTMREIAELNRRLIEASPRDYPPWIAVDQEGGRVARLGPPVVALPPMRVLGAIDQPSLTRDAARLLGRQLRLLGFNLDLAPVLDIDTNAANPIIGDRAFGNDPEKVVRHALAFASGLEQAGISGCGKHFPGHGDSEIDSHLALPRIKHERERLDRVELVPFKAAAGALTTMMTAHLVCEAIDPRLPATLSPSLLTTLLRKQLGYTGVVFSDDMEMKAISDNFSVEDSACLAIEAGCDALLYCSRSDHLFRAYQALVRKGEKEPGFARRLRQAKDRALRARRRFRPRAPKSEVEIEKALLAENSQEIEARIQRQRSKKV
ncbi:MAG: beta-N-acetylhexosaminidase [Deltaproteobacteria bacterium]|nr:beta-N-acetylhexosaminidase [Deltaproteobacteria bacterium]